MKKTRLFTVLMACVLLLPCLAGLSGCDSGYDVVLNVYNWGEYISDGSYDSLNVNDAFEAWYYQEYGVRVKVNYDTYDSNESLRAKLEAGSASYDVIIPSDYMIDYFIEHDMLLELNFDNIPNFEKNIPEQFRNLFYDPENKYTVPYTYGMVGIVYDANIVDEEDVGSWDLMWNPDYAKQILQFDNSRDAFGIAQYKLGIDVNTTDKALLQQCADELKKQRPLVQQYVMDQVYDKMIEGNAWIAPYYAGDAMMMMEENPDLRFYLPESENFNLFIDAMCIPTCCKEKDAAELFINFMCNPEISGANMDYICYGSPIDGATDYMDEYLAESEVIYPPAEILDRGRSYAFLPEDITRFVENLFLQVRVS